MKIFVLVVLSGIVACTYADDTVVLTVDEAKTKAGEVYVGELRETMGGEIGQYINKSSLIDYPKLLQRYLHYFSVRVGTFEDDAMMTSECEVPRGIATCKLGFKWGNPACFMKCKSVGKMGGYCKGTKCTCVV